MSNNPDILLERETRSLPHGQSERWVGKIPDPQRVYTEYEKRRFPPSALELKKFEQSKVIVFWDFMGAGIGDVITALRYMRCMAEHFPEKECVAFVHPAMLDVKHLALPPNCKLISRGVGFETDKYAQGVNIPLSVPMNILGSEELVKAPENIHDIACLRTLHDYGVDLTVRDLEKSIVSFPREEIYKTQYVYDYLFAPDAKEEDTLTMDRSMKSLSIEQCEAIFSRIPKKAVLGIVIGTAHPAHCEAVYTLARGIARKRGFAVTRAQTSTLDDLALEILKSNTFIGMDSGTTHWAYEVALAAKNVGRTIHIKEIFNSALFKISQYALRGGSDFVEVLHGPILPSGRNHREKMDVACIPRQDITDFIFGKSPVKGGVSKAHKRS